MDVVIKRLLSQRQILLQSPNPKTPIIIKPRQVFRQEPNKIDVRNEFQPVIIQPQLDVRRP